MKYENQTKQRIYDTAMKLFLEKSFHEVTIDEICKASGITKHTFYYYFSSKDALLKKYYVIPSEISPDDLVTILNADSYVEQLWLLNRNLIDFLEKTDIDILKQIVIKNLTSDIGTFNGSERHRKMLNLQTDVIKKGQKSGQFLNTSDPYGLAVIFHHSIMSSTFSWLMKKNKYKPEDTIRFMYESIFNIAPEYRKMPKIKWEDIADSPD